MALGLGTGFSFGAPSANAQQSQPQTQGLFGASTNQQQSQPQTQGLFGASTNQQQQQPPKPQGLFGSSTTQQQPSGSLFGNPTQQQQQPQQQGSSLFGAPASGNTGSSLFGSQQPAQQQQQQQPQQAAGGLFGAANKPFGQPTQNPLTLSQLGGSTSYSLQQSKPGLFGSSSVAPDGGASGGSNKRLGIPINDKLEQIRAAWDVQNIQTCHFLYYFYNSLPPNMPQLAEEAGRNPNFGRRQDALGPKHDALWLQTLRENPDRSKLVPVLAVGFEDLKTRMDLQEAEAARQSTKLVELQKRLDDLTSKHSLSNSVRISAISRKQTTLHHRLIGLAKRIHLLIPALRGHSITYGEEQLKNLLRICETELESISSMAANQASDGRNSQAQHRLRGRINELWALLGTLKSKREAARSANDGNAPLEWAVVDESAIEDVVKILASQQQGLDHISSTVQNDTKVLDTIIKGLEGVELVGVK